MFKKLKIYSITLEWKYYVTIWKLTKLGKKEKQSLCPTTQSDTYTQLSTSRIKIQSLWKPDNLECHLLLFKVDSIYFQNESWGEDEMVHPFLHPNNLLYFVSDFIFFYVVYTVLRSENNDKLKFYTGKKVLPAVSLHLLETFFWNSDYYTIWDLNIFYG